MAQFDFVSTAMASSTDEMTLFELVPKIAAKAKAKEAGTAKAQVREFIQYGNHVGSLQPITDAGLSSSTAPSTLQGVRIRTHEFHSLPVSLQVPSVGTTRLNRH